MRHSCINSFMTVKKKFTRQYGELVIGMDGKNNYRYGIHPNYKNGRKKNREKDGMPWHILNNVKDILMQEAIEFWPWKVVYVDRAETDDVMAVLVEDVANLNMVQVGLEEEPEPVLLDSRDGDMYQLHKHKNVKQWDSVGKTFVGPSVSPTEFTRLLIINGDAASDGVENVFSNLGDLANGVRQKAATEKRMAPILAHKNLFDYKEDPHIVKRLKENYQLVCFDGMPIDVRDEILEAWKNATKQSKMKMMRYLGDKKCKYLLEHIAEM